MASLNKVQLIGNLGRDPETRFLPNGDPVCNFSIATSETWKDKQSGEKKEAVEWHNIVIFGKLAEVAGKYLTRGSQVYLEGKLKTRKWQDKQTGADRYTTEVHVDQMRMLGGKPDGASHGGGGQPQQRQTQQQQKPAQRPQNDFEDDIPF